MDELTKPQMRWLFGSVLVGIVMLMVIPLAAVCNEVTYLNSSESDGVSVTPIQRRFNLVYWPTHVFVVLMWAIVIVIKAPEEPDIRNAMWKMIGIYSVLVFFSYFMHLAGKNYVIEHTDEIKTEKNAQMAAILSTFTIIIYIAGSVAAVVTLVTGRKDPDEESLISKMASKLRRNNEIERWPSKIDRISAMYEQLIEGSKRTPNERARMRKALVSSLKSVYTFKDAYQILQKEMASLNLDKGTREAFLVQAADIIAETDDNPAPSFLRKIISAVTPSGLTAPVGTAVTAKTSTNTSTVPEFVDVLYYEGAYIVIEVKDPGRAGEEEDIILPNPAFKGIKNANYLYNTSNSINKGETYTISMIKN